MNSRFLSRRAFVASGLAAGAAGLAMRVARAGERARRKIKIVDIHTHLGMFIWGQELTPEGLIKLMDAHDIERAVVLPLISPETSLFPQTTHSALAACKAHADRLIPFCCFDPRAYHQDPNKPDRIGRINGVPGMVELLKRYQDLGAKGFGEHQVGLPFDDPLMMTVYEALETVELPILFHLDDIRGADTPGLPRLEHALRSYPKLPMIGHACGFWASISADATDYDFGHYPTIPKPVVPGGALELLLAKYPNLYCDLSEPGGYFAIARDMEFGKQFVIRWADRLLFGTDYLMPDQEIPHFELYESLDLPEDVQAKIYRDNALRLLKLNDLG
jgi:predicted TIM-barrel fold metal-dependent hydrolase